MLRAIVISVATAVASTPATAQDWPARPVTMVVTFAPGTAGDVVGRILSIPLGEALGRAVIVDNVPGGGGITGANRIANAAPDGYQFLVGTVGTHAIAPTLYKNPPYNAVVDFAPVGLLLEQPIVLLARKDLPAATLKEFAAYTKVHQKTMQYGSGGTGTANHLACARLNLTLGVNVVHVPYRSTSAMQDLMAGRIDYTCNFLSTSMAQIESRQITAVAILTRTRSPMSPSIASAHEQGLTDFDAATWSGFFLPKNTPAAIVQKLNKAASSVVDRPSVQAKLREIGATVVEPERRSPAYLQAFVQSEIQKWAEPIKAANLTSN
ncbi:MAG: tripartite tricarboxylate transporter substrate binding protein [Xanthobacteraceae bacterium]|nr:tripartite tricarboxylate transporter substrate binding protein [Xanthobacteraceae bacterium]